MKIKRTAYPFTILPLSDTVPAAYESVVGQCTDANILLLNPNQQTYYGLEYHVTVTTGSLVEVR